MTGPEYAAALKQLGLTQVAASDLFGASPRSGRYWAKDGPPVPVGIVVKLLATGRLTLADVEAAKGGN